MWDTRCRHVIFRASEHSGELISFEGQRLMVFLRMSPIVVFCLLLGSSVDGNSALCDSI